MPVSGGDVGDSPSWRITTWNVQGAFGLNVAFVCAHIRAEETNVVVVQEVTARQAKRISALLHMHHVWARKHTPFPSRSEGLAILTSHRLTATETRIITRAMPWSWRRRILLRAHITNDTGESIDVINVHLSAHNATQRRGVELAQVVSLHPDIIAGDFNSELSDLSGLPGPFAPGPGASKFFDATEDTGPTCWTPGPRRGRLPTLRLDGFLVSNMTATDPHTPSADLDQWGEISDHLPVTVSVERIAR